MNVFGEYTFISLWLMLPGNESRVGFYYAACNDF